MLFYFESSPDTEICHKKRARLITLNTDNFDSKQQFAHHPTNIKVGWCNFNWQNVAR